MTGNPFEKVTDIAELLGQLAGASSMCWSDVRSAGEFQSTRAAELVAQAQERLVDLMGVRQAKAEAWREGYRAALSPEARQLMDEVREGVLRSTGRYDENSEPDPTATGEAERRGTGSENVALYQVRSDEDGPLEVVLDPDAPIGGGVVYFEELFENFSNLGKGSYRLGKEYTERLREELGIIERTNFADYLDAPEKKVDTWPGEWPEEQ